MSMNWRVLDGQEREQIDGHADEPERLAAVRVGEPAACRRKRCRDHHRRKRHPHDDLEMPTDVLVPGQPRARHRLADPAHAERANL